MATKTFKTRIKLKYDALNAWDSFSALQGEMLLGHKDGKIYAQVGTGDNGGKSPLWISGSNVDITGYSITTIKTAQDAITNLDSRINTITDGMVTSFGGETGVITVAGPLSMSGKALTIATATANSLGVVKVNNGNGLSLSDGTIAMAAASGTTAGAMSSGDYDKLLGIEAGAEVNDIVAVQVNGADLTPDGNRAVNVNAVTKITVPIGAQKTVGNDGNITLTAADFGLSNALHFRGVVSFNPEGDDTTTQGYQEGDVVLYGTKEYVLATVNNALTWVELGDASEEAAAITLLQGRMDTAEGNITGINSEIDAMDFELSGGAPNKTITVLTQTDGKITAATATDINIPTSQVTTLGGYTAVTGDGTSLTEGDTLNEALGKLERRIAINKENITTNTTAIATLNGTDTTNGSVAKSIKDAISALDSNATIATVANDVVTLNTTINEVDGKLTASSGTIELAKVAKTGAAVDVSIADTGNLINATNVEGALAEIVGKVNTNATAINNLHQVATSGKISDLEQAASTVTNGLTNTDDMIIFDCGSATENTLTETNA